MTRNASIFLTLLFFLLAGISPTTGKAFGAASVDVAVNGFGKGKAVHTGWQGTGDWTKQLRVPPGNHAMTATARHPSGQFSPAASHKFSANTGQQTVSNGLLNNLIQEIDPQNEITDYFYDTQLRLERINDKMGDNTYFDYTATHQLETLTNQLNHAISYTYHPNGLLWTVKDAENKTTTTLYDAFGNPNRITYQEQQAPPMFGQHAPGHCWGTRCHNHERI